MRTFLFGFLLVAAVVAIVGFFAGPVPKAVSDESRAEAEAAGAARGRYLAEREAERSAIDLAPSLAQDEIDAQLNTGDPALAYEEAYQYAWNDAVDTLSRRVPRQLLADEDHTQWIELLQ